jgi:hypothetical protein
MAWKFMGNILEASKIKENNEFLYVMIFKWIFIMFL